MTTKKKALAALGALSLEAPDDIALDNKPLVEDFIDRQEKLVADLRTALSQTLPLPLPDAPGAYTHVGDMLQEQGHDLYYLTGDEVYKEKS
jgi:hypothetical protein